MAPVLEPSNNQMAQATTTINKDGVVVFVLPNTTATEDTDDGIEILDVVQKDPKYPILKVIALCLYLATFLRPKRLSELKQLILQLSRSYNDKLYSYATLNPLYTTT